MFTAFLIGTRRTYLHKPLAGLIHHLFGTK
jgi:hypothetical protein